MVGTMEVVEVSLCECAAESYTQNSRGGREIASFILLFFS